MKEVVVKTVYAFSMDNKGGNPAGVVLNADGLSNEEMQRTATAVGLSEVVFISQSSVADFKLEFFTPACKIPHCGHATIAAFSYLKKQGFITGDRSSKETIDGNRDIYFKNGYTYMQQNSPSHIDVDEDTPEILTSLNLCESDLQANLRPAIVNTGNSFLIVPVADEITLKSIQPDLEKIRAYSVKHDLIGYYIFCSLAEENVSASTRMFAPRYGIDEESATGMAAGPLACYLFANKLTAKTELIIKQGEYMEVPSPSLIQVNLIVKNGKIEKLYAGGTSLISGETRVRI